MNIVCLMNVCADDYENLEMVLNRLFDNSHDIPEDKVNKPRKSTEWCAKYSEVYNGDYTVLASTRYSRIDYIKKLPKTSGVYFFFDKDGTLVYVGSSKDIAYRVPQSYGERNGCEDVHSIAYQTTGDVDVARALEAAMIRKYKPLKNVIVPTIESMGDELNAYELEKHNVEKWSI